MKNLNDIPVSKNSNGPGFNVDYDKAQHGKLLGDALSRGERVAIGQGDTQITFNPRGGGEGETQQRDRSSV